MNRSVLAIAAALTIALPVLADPVKIGVASEPYPPFTSLDANGTWVGWEIDFMNAVCKQAELDCVITPTAWDGIIPSLTSGQIDVIMASMSITEERAKIIDFSDSYYNSHAIVIVPKDSSATADPEGMTGKIIGIQVGTVLEDYARKYFTPVAAEINSYQTMNEAVLDLNAGRVDAVLDDSIALDAFLKSETGQACCKVAGAVMSDPDILGHGVGFGLRKGDPILAKLNAAIQATRADGTYDAITKKYFDFDISGQ
ncbi:MAG: transporter substrate-binding domain-containing protein [Albidovulum sp.]|uniref:transporter substrate-binding domain-containing protein n=1 Tax=Albidovulum sp. TaxID=1872424 RepID=UPI003CB52552